MLEILAAAAFVLPEAGRALESHVVADLPEEVLESNIVGFWFRSFVSDTGEILDCHPVAVYGDADHNDAVCSRIVGRRIKPARGPDGEPIPAFVNGVISLDTNLSQLASVRFEPDFHISVASLPGGVKSPVRQQVIALVDRDGQVVDCSAEKGGEGALTDAICEDLKRLNMPIRQAEDGSATAYLYPFTIEVEEAAG